MRRVLLPTQDVCTTKFGPHSCDVRIVAGIATRNHLKLIQHNDELTFTEVKICMYIKMNFSNKQILELMHISDSTLSNLRSSIRKKLSLDRKKGLFSIIANL